MLPANSVVRGPDIASIPETHTMPQQYIEYMNQYVPRRWREQFTVFANDLRNNEVLHPNYPIMLCDSSSGLAICLV